MSIFEVDCNQVTLSGVILSAHLTLHNPHEILAVIFELQSKPAFLQIEPVRGMIMQGERKIIKLRCKNEARAQLQKIERAESQLMIRGSYFSEYNKKVMAKNNLKGWSLISKEFKEITLPVYFNFAEEMEKVREEAHRSHSLRSSRKMNSFQKFRESSIKRVKNERLNEDLDFIFRNEEFKKNFESKRSHEAKRQRKEQWQRDQKASTAPQLFQNFAQSRKDLDEILSPILKSKNINHEVQTPAKLSPPPFREVEAVKAGKEGGLRRESSRQRRGMDLIILAIIAALFLGLGEGMGRQLKY